MLSSNRINEGMYTVPKYELKSEDASEFQSELKAYQEGFGDFFTRQEIRNNFAGYMAGQFSGLERKSIEPIADHVEGCKPRCMQRCLSESTWDQEAIHKHYHEMVDQEIGIVDGVVVLGYGNDSCKIISHLYLTT